jgi:hypothetical protein
MRSPTQFFDRLRSDAKPLLTWVGELVIESEREGARRNEAKYTERGRKEER